MNKLDLNKYSDREIVAAFFDLPAMKFIATMSAMAAITERMTKRGNLIARNNSDELVGDMIRRLFEENE